MAPSVSTKYIYRCNGSDSSCSMLEEKWKTESEVYWDLGTVTTYTIFFFCIYFLVWMAKFVIKLFVAKKVFSIISVKGKKVLVKLFPVLDKHKDDIVENKETKNKDQDDDFERI